MDVPQFIAGRFRIECEIGTGGMGTVYRATHLGLERPVAVKIIKTEFAADRDVADRFLREARTMAKLRHPHAAMIFDAGTLPDGRHFIIMEFVEGTTLSEALARDVRFSPDRAVKIAVQICDVLEEAHQLGIIHRDLKPSNIMLNERGVCVLDFGVAKVLATSTESTATHATTGSGNVVGTPRYMSPEQCLGQRVGARSDLYSLGVVLYEMLAGRPPFIDPLPSAVLIKQATVPAPPLPQMCQGVPRQLALAVHTLLAKRPEDRPRTAAAARALLEKSLVRPSRVVPETEPLASTLAVLADRSSILFRLTGPLATVFLFGALLFVWGNSGETAPEVVKESTTAAQLSPSSLTSPNRVAATGSRKLAIRTATGNYADTAPDAQPPSTLGGDRARIRGIANLSPGSDDVQVIKTAAGPAVVAIQNGRRNGASQFLIMEKRGSAFYVSARGTLESKNFRRAQWTTETVDADGDDYDEVLFSGTDSNRQITQYRFVIYVAKRRQSYVLELETDARTGAFLRVAWSENALSPWASPYRKVLREKANSVIAKITNH